MAVLSQKSRPIRVAQPVGEIRHPFTERTTHAMKTAVLRREHSFQQSSGFGNDIFNLDTFPDQSQLLVSRSFTDASQIAQCPSTESASSDARGYEFPPDRHDELAAFPPDEIGRASCREKGVSTGRSQ